MTTRHGIAGLSIVVAVAITGFSFSAVADEHPPVRGQDLPKVTPPPAELKLNPFYRKYISASGYPVVFQNPSARIPLSY